MVGCYCSNEQDLVCLYFYGVVVTPLTGRLMDATQNYGLVYPDFGPMIYRHLSRDLLAHVTPHCLLPAVLLACLH